MRLYLIRHGEAEPGLPLDAQRALTQEGSRQVEKSAAWLFDHTASNAPMRLLASPYVRAQQSAKVVARRLHITLESSSLLTPDADLQETMDMLWRQQGPLVLVTHLPLVAQLADQLVGEVGAASNRFWPTAAVMALSGSVFTSSCMTQVAVYGGLAT